MSAKRHSHTGWPHVHRWHPCKIVPQHEKITSQRALVCCAGQPMVPISWEEMQCPDTKGVEKRKVAKTLP